MRPTVERAHTGSTERHRMPRDRYREEPDATFAALVGFIVGFVLLIALTYWAARPAPQGEEVQGLLSAVPGRATFEVAALHALGSLSAARPVGDPSATTIDLWAGAYLEEGVGPARDVLANHAAPLEVQEVRDMLVRALDSYVVALGAAQSCLEQDVAKCRSHLSDLRSASDEVDRLSGDLRLFLFG